MDSQWCSMFICALEELCVRCEQIASKNRTSGRLTDGTSKFPLEILAARQFYSDAKKKASADLQAELAKQKMRLRKFLPKDHKIRLLLLSPRLISIGVQIRSVIITR